MRYVIIGNGVAAIGAVEGIRLLDHENPITMISSEPYITYGRPLISNLLSGKIKEAEMFYRPEAFYKDNKVDLLLGRIAVSIDTAARLVRLEDGDTVHYDRLLIATGGKPFIPPIEGRNGPDVYTFTSLEDAKRLEAVTGKAKNIVVIGGGLIGLKAAEGLHDRGARVTVIELADRILSVAFDHTAGHMIGKRLLEVGIEIITSNSVAEIMRGEKNHIVGVRLKDGRGLNCEAVVIAIGVVPNKDIIVGTGIEANRGILVNTHLETSVVDIYAAGDVAEALDLLTGERRVVPIWPNAYAQGRYAGRNMAGAGIDYEGGLPMNSIEFYGIPTMSVGIANPGNDLNCEILTRVVPEKNIYKKMVLQENVLIGAVLVGVVERAGIYTGLIKNRSDVGEFKDQLLADDFGLVSFPKEMRKRLLAV